MLFVRLVFPWAYLPLSLFASDQVILDGKLSSTVLPVANFARAALAARDNFRVTMYYERGEKKFPDDTHFDELDWEQGFSEVWLYALRNARVAIKAEADQNEDNKQSATASIRKLSEAEHVIIAASLKSEKKGLKHLKLAWRNANMILAKGGSIDALLTNLSHSNSNVVADVPKGFGSIGVAHPSKSLSESEIGKAITLSNGVPMPRWGLGTTMLTRPKGEEVMLQAVRDHHYRLIDSAQSYTNEKQVGRAVERSGVNRSDVFIVTKLSEPEDMQSVARVQARIKKQLRNLRTPYIDLYFLHGPDDFPDGCVRAWRVMEDLYRNGTLRALGVSNFDVNQLRAFFQLVTIPPHVVQNKFSIYHHGSFPMPTESFLEAIQITNDVGAPLGFMGYCNLDVYPDVLEPMKDPHVYHIAAAHNRTVAQVLLRHALQMGTAVIPKTEGRHGRLAENAEIFDFRLEEGEMLYLNSLSQLASIDPIAYVADLYSAHVHTKDFGPTKRSTKQRQEL